MFVDRLDEELKAHGLSPLIDRSEIYAFEDWWHRIQILIVKSDTIVFVINPDSILSDVCDKEVAVAKSLGKKIAPITL